MLCIGTERKSLILKLNYNLNDSLMSMSTRIHSTLQITQPGLAIAIFDAALLLTNTSSGWNAWMPAAYWQQTSSKNQCTFFFSAVLKTTQGNYSSSATHAEHWTCLSHSLTWTWHTHYKFHLARGFITFQHYAEVVASFHAAQAHPMPREGQMHR